MKKECELVRKKVDFFQGGSLDYEHLKHCGECRKYVKDNYPELQFSFLNKRSDTDGMLDDLKIDVTRKKRKTTGNVIKIAAALVLLISLAWALILLNMWSVSETRKTVQSPQGAERLKANYPLVESVDSSKTTYVVSKTKEGTRIVHFYLKEDEKL